MRVALVTGSSGFIGTNLVKKLKKEGYMVYEWTRNCLQTEECIYNKSLSKAEDIEEMLGIISPDIVMHCAGAANVGESLKNPYEDMIANYVITHNLLFAIKLKCPNCRMIFFSSAAVYGNPKFLPMDENAPINPLSPYALHKRAAEEVCEYMNINYGINVKILRIFSVYGPGQKKQIFWDMYQKIKMTGKLELLGGGNESRDYIFIDDLVNVAFLVSQCDDRSVIYYNVGNGEETTIEKAAMTFAKHMGVMEKDVSFNGNRREGDPVNWCANIERIRALGYRREYSFEQGIKAYIGWANKSIQNED